MSQRVASNASVLADLPAEAGMALEAPRELALGQAKVARHQGERNVAIARLGSYEQFHDAVFDDAQAAQVDGGQCPSVNLVVQQLRRFGLDVLEEQQHGLAIWDVAHPADDLECQLADNLDEATLPAEWRRRRRCRASASIRPAPSDRAISAGGTACIVWCGRLGKAHRASRSTAG